MTAPFTATEKVAIEISAALAGEISDVDDNGEEQAGRKMPISKPPRGYGDMRTSALLGKRTMSRDESQLKKSSQSKARITRYPTAKPLALNILYKVPYLDMSK
ncbi:unnamed protein product [Gongylonema pulchrum]|uniref:Uncharacterized protein n=1 Tax=Gongylonema pulchrum TaxID=637853 RepID=A0A183CZ06_9BILA|nr:unnamed protein product [Gongylonema pulchrum]